MKDAKVSIILPVYNAKEYIKDCIDSILAQNFLFVNPYPNISYKKTSGFKPLVLNIINIFY